MPAAVSANAHVDSGSSPATGPPARIGYRRPARAITGTPWAPHIPRWLAPRTARHGRGGTGIGTTYRRQYTASRRAYKPDEFSGSGDSRQHAAGCTVPPT